MYAHFRRSASLFLAALAFAASAHAGPVIANGGFETGDLGGWSLGASSAFAAAETGVQRSGDYAAVFGEVGASVLLPQSVATEAGRSYRLSFWLENAGGSSSADSVNLFQVMLGANTLYAFSDKSAAGYQQHAFTFTADAALSELVFSFQHDDTFWLFDDVSISEVATGTPVPEPSSVLLFGAALAASALRRRA
ncbi:carbohydrate binding domain-containing protein [Massilia yuzhufengensis]|uniref:PEP-CTERM protein-sorting domain-containing protein n=1 Tax=Massilia yuzhufengensis TaxID=1164594 RepID=A0A1I1QT93_9BURK|nr:carbohydrate binding domain-containing protein [Massilia yuzhufengensis]SFD25222.1 PEP-CTERM protein-sorting domain-containing protein [Massilia yuzhufengensis]